MFKIGILLPGSTLYPSIGIDFLQGIRSCISFHHETGIELMVFPIGFGLNEKDIYIQAEKWLLADNADVIVLYAEDRLANILSPLFVATGKLLVISNPGAQYPQIKTGSLNTLFHSLNDNLCTFLTGRLCASETATEKNAVLATSFYDGGYQHCHAMANAFTLGGGEIKSNVVIPFNKEMFDINGLTKFLESNSDVKNLLCLFCGDMAAHFYEQLKLIQQRFDLDIYGSPMMFDSSPGDFPDIRPAIHQARGYLSWAPELVTNENSGFLHYYKKENNREASLFSLQGWELMTLLITYINNRLTGGNVNGTIEKLRSTPLQSPRGVLHINDKNAVLAPVYLVSASHNPGLTIEDVIENTSSLWQEMVDQVPEQDFSTWKNTYLCM